jgi:site-specific DNA-methyltransferase (adenine-specific)
LIYEEINNCRKSKNKESKNGVFGKERSFGISKAKNYPKNILNYSNPNNNLLHPTQKPVKLLEYLINTYTIEGELVLDNCMGSGSTGVACVNTNRNFIGIEKEEKYFNIAKERIKTAYGGD